jgi:hypothetical protein
MPGTPQEFVALLGAWPDDSLIPPPGHRWGDGTAITPDEEADLLALRVYAHRLRARRRWGRAQARARRLLRSLLSAEQRGQLRRWRYFLVAAPSGSVYRLNPRCGHVERVERHGRRWFVREAFCLHDAPDDGQMPPADLSVAHLLLLRADEEAFLATANRNPRNDQLWNRDYLRRIRDHREAVRANLEDQA